MVTVGHLLHKTTLPAPAPNSQVQQVEPDQVQERRIRIRCSRAVGGKDIKSVSEGKAKNEGGSAHIFKKVIKVRKGKCTFSRK